MSRSAELLALLLLLCVPGAAARQSTADGKQAVGAQKPEAQATAAEAQVKAANADPSYIIGAEDVLNINVWKEADISRTVPVRPDGRISLPLLNDVQAAGLTPQQLADSIRDGLKKFMSDPVVTVIVTAVNRDRKSVV